MQRADRTNAADLNQLRLLGLGRIPMCADCPRLAALGEGLTARPGVRQGGELPAVPAGCAFQFCAPLATRIGRDAPVEASHAA